MFYLNVKQAASFLASRQDNDGYWRDYQLEPGRSDAWITATVGFALFKVRGLCKEVKKAVHVLRSTVRPGGWGYNSSTACDADTTSWAILFLSSARALEGINASDLLTKYITSSGGVHTFPTLKHFGSWAKEHDDVAPNVGMALLSIGEVTQIKKLRKRILERPVWESFWWQCYSYVCAQSLEFLSLSGGIPEEIIKRERIKIECLSSAPSSILDLSQRLLINTYLELNVGHNELPDLQLKDGGWSSSAELLGPGQHNDSPGKTNVDDRRLMSTALSLLTLLKIKSKMI